MLKFRHLRIAGRFIFIALLLKAAAVFLPVELRSLAQELRDYAAGTSSEQESSGVPLVDAFKEAVEMGNWAQATSLVEEIIEINPNISTSWFNYGVCLENLGRHKDAVNAFQRAYALSPQGYEAMVRILQSYYLADDLKGFLNFFG